MNFKQAKKMIESKGWVLERINGSHHIFTHENHPDHIILSKHAGDIPKGLINKIKKQAGLK